VFNATFNNISVILWLSVLLVEETGVPETTNINYIEWVRVMVFNATFNNISAISRWSVLMIEETGVPGENHHKLI